MKNEAIICPRCNGSTWSGACRPCGGTGRIRPAP
jgi:hypothetical protein